MIWILLVIMQFKHFIADYPLQNAYMLGKFKDKGWIIPLAAHCGVHFLFTFIIAGLFLPSSLSYSDGYSFMFKVALLDFCIHFVMDRIKASPKLLGRFQALSKNEMIELLCNNPADSKYRIDKLKSNVLFWYSLGLDQMVHHLTDLLIVYLIISKLGL